ncbi:DUF4240 domain-containing protein [Flammeovirgaceae bacterium SG7u.111]|nr:DUF4240 domain-containing protein [Flammeovirgaceae bacterium SG7u.132]WPO38025.1 DUF4240 domain-containing protein [Flammeovirgaceae bacterium SG7u.111]
MIKINKITLIGLMGLLSIIFGCKTVSNDKKKSDTVVEDFKKYRDKEKEDGFFIDFNESKFWEIIDYSKQKFPDNKDLQVDLLIDIIADREDEEIFRFNLYKDWVYYQAYTSDLWAIAYTATCGCSDDSFSDYRSWLITEGKDKYYKILKASPDDLVDSFETTKDINGRCEKFHSFSYYVYEKKYPESIDPGWDFDDKYSKFDKSELNFDFPKLEFNWEGIEDIKKLFPRFYKKYNNIC